MADRRTLSFASLDRVMPEVDRLLDEGYSPSGNWTLGQMCHHLTKSIQGSVEGYGMNAPWLVRRTVGPIVLRRLLKTQRMPAGLKTAKSILPRSDHDDRAEVEALRATIAYYITSSEPLAEHPFFGVLDRDTWTGLHCLHAAHHLSFALPRKAD